MRELYAAVGLDTNFFPPVMKLREELRIEGSRAFCPRPPEPPSATDARLLLIWPSRDLVR